MQNNPTASIIDQLANTITSTFSHKIIFSEPIEKDGIIVIPVAKISYGFGGGSGKRTDDSGNGGGGGLFAKPIGYIEIKNGESSFKPIHEPVSQAGVIIAGGIAGYLVLKGLRRLFR